MLLLSFSLIFVFLFSLSPLFFDGLFGLFAGAAMLFAAVSAWYATRKIRVSFSAFLLALLTALFLSLSVSDVFSVVTILCAAVAYYFLLQGVRRQYSHIVAIVSFLQFLGFGFLILYAYVFSYFPMWLAALSVFFLSAVLFFTSLSMMTALSFGMELRLMLFSVIVGFLMAEFYFALSRLPLNIVSIDFLLFVIYYVAWDIVWRYFSLRFTKRSLILHVVFLAAAFAAVFLSSR